ncbi:MAG: hypothetical protein P0107_03590 [Nitrosomonas sp.]|nr:hypothetical protein [Nitrosomonas sp.]
MGILNILNQSPSAKNLQRLFLLRIIAIISQIIIFWTVYSIIELELPWTAIIVTISLLAVLNFLTWIRLRYSWLVTNPEFFTQLLIDVAGLTALLYFSGGSTNPFISLYLLPLPLQRLCCPGVTPGPWRPLPFPATPFCCSSSFRFRMIISMTTAAICSI